MNDEKIREILSKKQIAVVGCSGTPGKAAHEVPRYLQKHGYHVIPVNPYSDEILGEKSYDSISDAATENRIDVVDIFRPSEEVEDIVDEALEHDIDVIWMQLGITDVSSVQKAQKQDIEVVMDKCIKQEHERLMD